MGSDPLRPMAIPTCPSRETGAAASQETPSQSGASQDPARFGISGQDDTDEKGDSPMPKSAPDGGSIVPLAK
eukprot:3059659-Pyramimonas_sp.AAC.1